MGLMNKISYTSNRIIIGSYSIVPICIDDSKNFVCSFRLTELCSKVASRIVWTSGRQKIERSLSLIMPSKHADYDGGFGTRPPDLDDDDHMWQVSARSVPLQHSVLQYFWFWWFLIVNKVKKLLLIVLLWNNNFFSKYSIYCILCSLATLL